jgi:hypothetical protein
MRIDRLACSSFAVLMMGSGCFSGSAYRPERTRAPEDVSDADLYASTIRVLDDMGLGIRMKDKDAGIVASDFVDAGSIGFGSVFHAWRVRIEEGELRVEIECMIAAPSHVPSPCGAGSKRSDEWIAAAPVFAEKIVADAGRRAQRRREREAADDAAAAEASEQRKSPLVAPYASDTE